MGVGGLAPPVDVAAQNGRMMATLFTGSRAKTHYKQRYAACVDVRMVARLVLRAVVDLCRDSIVIDASGSLLIADGMGKTGVKNCENWVEKSKHGL